MRNVLPLLFLLMLQGALASEESIQVRKSLKALIDPILRKNGAPSTNAASDFTLRSCEKHSIDWKSVLLLKGSATLKYTFAPGCDIEGVIHPALLQNFPVDLKLKNLQDFNRLLADNKITASFEDRPVLNLAVRGARLISKKGEIKFEADYAVKVDLTNQKNFVNEDLGGEIRISEIYGEKVSHKEKFKLQSL